MKVSIVTVTYNSAATLKDTIESVLLQTYPNIEYWIIDGNSSDNTLEIIRSYEQKFNGRLHYLSETDKGIYDAMNKGIEQATGDVIGILNSDDFFTSNQVVERVVNAFTPDIDMIYGDVHFVRDNKKNKCIRYYSGRMFHRWMLHFGFIPPHPSLYLRKAVYEKYGLYDMNLRISADFELMARLFIQNDVRYRYVHHDCVTMRQGGESTRNLKNILLGATECLLACRKLGIYSNKLMIRCKYFFKLIAHFY